MYFHTIFVMYCKFMSCIFMSCNFMSCIFSQPCTATSRSPFSNFLNNVYRQHIQSLLMLVFAHVRSSGLSSENVFYDKMWLRNRNVADFYVPVSLYGDCISTLCSVILVWHVMAISLVEIIVFLTLCFCLSYPRPVKVSGYYRWGFVKKDAWKCEETAILLLCVPGGEKSLAIKFAALAQSVNVTDVWSRRILVHYHITALMHVLHGKMEAAFSSDLRFT